MLTHTSASCARRSAWKQKKNKTKFSPKTRKTVVNPNRRIENDPNRRGREGERQNECIAPHQCLRRGRRVLELLHDRRRLAVCGWCCLLLNGALRQTVTDRQQVQRCRCKHNIRNRTVSSPKQEEEPNVKEVRRGQEEGPQ